MRKNSVIATGLIITGTGRSGTTILWQLLNAHPELSIIYEPFTMNFFPIQNLQYFNGFKQPSFNWRFEDYVADKYIFIKRNLWDNLYSLIVRNGNDFSLMDISYHRIKSTNKRINIFSKANPEKSLIVQYEKLCLETETELRKVCEFLEVNFIEKMLKDWTYIRPPYWAKSAQYKFNKIKFQTGKYKKDKAFLKELNKLKEKYNDHTA